MQFGVVTRKVGAAPGLPALHSPWRVQGSLQDLLCGVCWGQTAFPGCWQGMSV